MDIPKDFGHAGSAGHNSHNENELAEALRDVATDLEAALGDGPAWNTGIAVSSHTVTLPRAGHVLHVHATTGSSTGPKTIISTGTPGDGQVRVTYSNGIPTLLFDTSDAVTVCSVHQIRRPATFAGRLTQAV
jgi:hypothetical protein